MRGTAPFDADAAQVYGALRADLEQQGRPIGRGRISDRIRLHCRGACRSSRATSGTSSESPACASRTGSPLRSLRRQARRRAARAPASRPPARPPSSTVPAPDAQLLAVDDRRARERALVRRALDLEHGVGDRAARARASASWSSVLWSTWLVSAYSIRLAERLDDRLLDRLEAVLEEERRERRLEQRGEHVAVLAPAARARPSGSPSARSASTLAEPELARDDGAARPRDDVRADLRHPPLAEVRVAVVERARDRELEHAVAEELEPLVRGRPVGSPGRVGEDGLGALRRQLARSAAGARAAGLPAAYWCDET